MSFARLYPIGVVAVHREEDAAIFHSALVTLGLIFRNAHADQGANEPACRRADTQTRECAHDGTCGDERSKAGNRKRSNTGKQSQRATYRTARRRSGCRAFRRFRVLFGGEFLGCVLIGSQDRYVIAPESPAIKASTQLSACVRLLKIPNAAVFFPAIVFTPFISGANAPPYHP